VEHIKLNKDETHELLRCLTRAHELAEDTDNLDIVAMAGTAMDMLIDKWEKRTNG
jgi:hypothetical protein